MKIKCLKFKALEKGKLRGFADLLIGPVGPVLRECALTEGPDGDWIALPSKSYEHNGGRKWSRLVEFPDREVYDDFQRSAVKAIRDFRRKGGEPRPMLAKVATAIDDSDIPF